MQRSGRAGKVFDEGEFEATHDAAAIERAACGGIGALTAISLDKHLWVCCGIESSHNPILDAGDLNEISVVDALKKVADNVILTAIHTVGAHALIRFVKDKNPTITFKNQYFAICEVCGDLTTNEKAVRILNSNLLTLFKMIKEAEQMLKEGKSK